MDNFIELVKNGDKIGVRNPEKSTEIEIKGSTDR